MNFKITTTVMAAALALSANAAFAQKALVVKPKAEGRKTFEVDKSKAGERTRLGGIETTTHELQKSKLAVERAAKIEIARPDIKVVPPSAGINDIDPALVRSRLIDVREARTQDVMRALTKDKSDLRVFKQVIADLENRGRVDTDVQGAVLAYANFLSTSGKAKGNPVALFRELDSQSNRREVLYTYARHLNGAATLVRRGKSPNLAVAEAFKLMRVAVYNDKPATINRLAEENQRNNCAGAGG